MTKCRGYMLGATVSFLIWSAPVTAQQDAPNVEEDSVTEGLRCVSSRPIRKTEVLDDQNILFYMRGAAIYLNHLPKPCKRLSRDGRFMYRTSVARICRYDLINVLNDTGAGVTAGRACKLGSFYAITKEDVEKLKTPAEVAPKSIPPVEPEAPGGDQSEQIEASETDGIQLKVNYLFIL